MAATLLDVCAVVPAAGFGRRMQTECPKQYLSIGNKTILEHSVDALLAHPRVTRVVIAISPGDSRFAQLPLAQHPHIMAFHQAPKEYGGDAALLILIEVEEWQPPELP